MMEHVQGRVSQDDGEGVDEDDNHPDIQEPGQYILYLNIVRRK